MSSGVTHSLVATIVGAGCTIAAGYAYKTGFTPEATGILVGAWAGFLITPDIDHHARTIEEIRISILLGGFVGRIYQACWAPYEVMIPHGHFLSHIPWLGTLGRIIYISIPFLFYYWASGHDMDAIVHYIKSATWIHWAFLVWGFQDFWHWAFDGFRVWGTDHSKRRKKHFAKVNRRRNY